MEWLISLWNVSVQCSVGILLIFAVSPLLQKKHTVFWRYCLWIALAVRLVFPFDISLPAIAVEIPLFLNETGEQSVLLEGFGKGGHEETLNPGEEKTTNQKQQEESQIDIAPHRAQTSDVLKKPVRTGNVTENSEQSFGVQRTSTVPHKAAYLQQAYRLAAIVWATGAAAFFLWQVICYIMFCQSIEKTKQYVVKRESLTVCRSPIVGVPMLIGFWKPQIILADRDYTKTQLDFILSHEMAHYKRKDLWAKLLFAAAKTVHWFNPFIYWMQRQAAADIELLCDSDVVKIFSKEEKKQYGQALLDCASSYKKGRIFFGASGFTREAKNLKNRFANLLAPNKRKNGAPAAFLGVFALLSSSLLIACTAPGLTGDSPNNPSAKNVRLDSPETEALQNEDIYLRQKNTALAGLQIEDAANAVYGAVFPKLIYASDERAILYDYWGLLIYDIKNSRIKQLLDLKNADLCHIQGELFTHIEVSEDGRNILLYNEPNARERFIYDIDEKHLKYTDQKTFGSQQYKGLYERKEKTFAKTSSGKIVYLSVDSLYTGEGEAFHPDDMQGLSLIVTEGLWGGSDIYPLFSEYYEDQKETAFPYPKMEDIGKVLGKELLYEDGEGWSYYLEEDEKGESAISSLGAAIDPLLITRYKNEERQILEDLLFTQAWLECPVLFSGGRIVYKAAVTPDITGIKDATLISISMDGSDRKIAHDVQYRVFDALCEDDGWLYYAGWTNDGVSSGRLCRISPDFSSGAQFVEEIPGLICGVESGFVYYLASSEKNSGVWKRSLSTREEQICDKWGLSAEDLLYLYPRETANPPGITILYQTKSEASYAKTHIPYDET